MENKTLTPIEMAMMAEVQVSYRSKLKKADRTKITSSREAEKYLRMIWPDTIELQETFFVLFLNRANEVIGWKLLSTGGISGTVADIRLIFATALKTLATGIIIAHNHPSGQLIPSYSDEQLTNKIKSSGDLLEIKLLDHIILTAENCLSFADEGKL